MPFITQLPMEYAKNYLFLEMTITHDGTAIRDYIHVVDLAKAHVKAWKDFVKFESSVKFSIWEPAKDTPCLTL